MSVKVAWEREAMFGAPEGAPEGGSFQIGFRLQDDAIHYSIATNHYVVEIPEIPRRYPYQHSGHG
jgi:hypothetical protein